MYPRHRTSREDIRFSYQRYIPNGIIGHWLPVSSRDAGWPEHHSLGLWVGVYFQEWREKSKVRIHITIFCTENMRTTFEASNKVLW